MRRFDKKDNIRRANLLSEQRYLNSKGSLSEGKYFADALDKGTKIKFDGKIATITAHEYNPNEEVLYTIKFDGGGEEKAYASDKRIEKLN